MKKTKNLKSPMKKKVSKKSTSKKSKKPMKEIDLELELLQPHSHGIARYGGADGRIFDSRLTITQEALRRLECVGGKDQLLISVNKKQVYIAKKPENFFGYTIPEETGANSISISCGVLKHKEIDLGLYKLGEPFIARVPNANRVSVPVRWFPCEITE